MKTLVWISMLAWICGCSTSMKDRLLGNIPQREYVNQAPYETIDYSKTPQLYRFEIERAEKLQPVYKGIGTKGLSVSNGEIAISYSPDTRASSIALFMLNKTDSPMRVHWAESVFIQAGMSEPVIPDGTRLITRDEIKPPSIIAPKSKIVTSATPRSLIRQSDYGWKTDPICRYQKVEKIKIGDSYKAVPEDHRCIGNEYGMLITYDVGDKKKSIIFRFVFAGHEEPTQ